MKQVRIHAGNVGLVFKNGDYNTRNNTRKTLVKF